MGSSIVRSCSRVSCRATATMTLTYIYAESKAVVGPIATFSEPHSYDLCERHGAKLTVPNGWSVDRQITTTEGVGPSEDDLMAIADAVREVARSHQESEGSSQTNESQAIGRRGHLRAVPS
jgi:hypothetical protein